MRRLLLTATALALTTIPAVAAPVSTGRIGIATFTLAVSDATQDRVEVSALTGGRVEVAVTRCSAGQCSGTAYYAGTLPAAAVTLDTGTASGRLRAVLGGQDLSILWTPAPKATALRQGTQGGGQDDETLTVYRVDPATAAVSLNGQRCSGSGGVGDAVFLQSSEGARGNAAPLRDLRLPAAKPVCSG